MTVLEAALENGIYIPNLCYHPDLKPVGICRLCMVEINGKRLDVACKTPVEQGMQIRTENPEISKIRKIAAELLIINHPASCLSCSENMKCELQKIANYARTGASSVESVSVPVTMLWESEILNLPTGDMTRW